MKIYDCFMYFDEDLILEIRLNYLSNFIDKFIIIESSFNHKGEKRNPQFNINKFERFKDKIEYKDLTCSTIPILKKKSAEKLSKKGMRKSSKKISASGRIPKKPPLVFRDLKTRGGFFIRGGGLIQGNTVMYQISPRGHYYINALNKSLPEAYFL